jgi:hypothetical protein
LPRAPKTGQRRPRGLHTPETSLWQAGLGCRGHTCYGVGMGGLPGMQLLALRTDMASPATAGPEAQEPGAQSPGRPAPTRNRLQRLQMLGGYRGIYSQGFRLPGHPPNRLGWWIPPLPTPHVARGPSYVVHGKLPPQSCFLGDDVLAVPYRSLVLGSLQPLQPYVETLHP